MTIVDYHAHYAAVRARLRGTAATPNRAIVKAKIPAPPKPPALPDQKPPEPELSEEDLIRLSRERVKGMIGLSNRRRLLLLTILEERDAYWKDLISESRRQTLVAIRHEICVALFDDGMSLSAIGRVMNRDHTTILHSLRKEPRIAKFFKTKPKGAPRVYTPVEAINPAQINWSETGQATAVQGPAGCEGGIAED